MLTLGGVAYLLLAAIPGGASEAGLASCWRGLRWAAMGLAFTEVAYVSVDSSILMGSSTLRLEELVLAPFFLAGFAAVVGAAAIAVLTRFAGSWSRLLLVPSALIILLAVVSTSHSASRMEDRLIL